MVIVLVRGGRKKDWSGGGIGILGRERGGARDLSDCGAPMKEKVGEMVWDKRGVQSRFGRFWGNG